MNIKCLAFVVLMLFIFKNAIAGPFDIVPLPVSIKKGEGSFQFKTNTELRHSPDLDSIAFYASGLLKKYFSFDLKSSPGISGPLSNCILLKINQPADELLGTEGYILKVTPQFVIVSANTCAGLSYGIQTIGQMLSGGDGISIPASLITDYPRFPYRGLHLDVSRHFMPIGFIYQLVDYMAMHKLNVFHWHLTDDQGWRLEIGKYPKLTETGAWRVNRENFNWNRRTAIQPGEKATYGGFYTREEVRKLVKYAQSRNVTIIPEIEMPAHAMAALAAYPELSCSGKNLGVPPGGVWPITHIFCAGKEETFTFLENILAEVMEMFPSSFIHVGGDEADKSEWKKCPLCQKRMKDENLKDERELQSYFIRRIEKFLNENGRNLIGWDEILEGGIAPEAAVMSWRGEEGGIAAAKLGHKVVMTPSPYCYLDYYQGDPSSEPLAIGGFIPLKKVYSYEPLPEVLNEAEKKMILGAQANLWTEYMPDPKHVEYMIFPRLAALAEVVWSPKENRDWTDFSKRMEKQFERYQKLGINCSMSVFQVLATPELNPADRTLKVGLSAEVPAPEIHYTTDGTVPTVASPLYSQPFAIDRPVMIKASVFRDNKPATKPLSCEVLSHKAIACTIMLKFPNSQRYKGRGDYTLVDGMKGSSNFADGKWLGFNKNDMVATIDLGKPTRINSIETDGLQDIGSWIFLPKEVLFEVSADGTNFRTLGTVTHKIPENASEKITYNFQLKKSVKNIMYVRVTSKNQGVCPKGHAGEGQNAWLFSSEIVVR